MTTAGGSARRGGRDGPPDADPLAELAEREDVLELLGIELGPVRLKCALLILKTLKAGVYGITQWPGEEEEKT